MTSSQPRSSDHPAIDVAHLIGGAWIQSGEVRDGHDPARPAVVVARTPQGGAEELRAAAAAARDALPGWAGMPAPPAARSCSRPRTCCSSGRSWSARTWRARRARRSPRASARRVARPASCATSRARRASRSARCTPRRRPGTRLFTQRGPVGVVGHDHPLELPHRDPRLEDRPGAGVRQHGAVQARGRHAADREPPRARRSSMPGCRRACWRWCSRTARPSTEHWIDSGAVDAVSFTGSEAVGRRAPGGGRARGTPRCSWSWAARTRSSWHRTRTWRAPRR